MKNKTMFPMFLTFIVLFVLSCTTRIKTASFTATLDGQNEVPPVMSEASGTADFWLSEDSMSMKYKITVHKLQDVTMAHLHLGVKGQNGDHIAWLYPPQPPEKEKPGITNGTLAEGTLKATDLIDKMQGKSIKDLIWKINEDSIYVNVHTVQHPDGEIRGIVVKSKGM